MMHTCKVFRIALSLGLLAAPMVQAAPIAACTQQEVDALNAYYLRGYQLSLSGRNLDVDTVMAFAAEGEDVLRQLSPGCRSGLERVGNALQERAQATGRPVRLPSVLFDEASDTYTVPGWVSCGPSACAPLQ
jgi:hypothetical protein